MKGQLEGFVGRGQKAQAAVDSVVQTVDRRAVHLIISGTAFLARGEIGNANRGTLEEALAWLQRGRARCSATQKKERIEVIHKRLNALSLAKATAPPKSLRKLARDSRLRA